MYIRKYVGYMLSYMLRKQLLCTGYTYMSTYMFKDIQYVQLLYLFHYLVDSSSKYTKLEC